MAKQKIHSILIIEVAGRPPEYLKNSLEIHVDKFKFLKEVELVSAKIAEPKRLEGEEELYTMFAEVEIKTLTLGRLMEIIFEFMPSSVEIVDPQDIEFNCQEATVLMNDLAGKLHKYDDLAKVAKFHIENLNSKLAKYESKQNNSPYQPIKVSVEDNTKEEKKSKKKKSTKKKN